jgi:hypothetical protein
MVASMAPRSFLFFIHRKNIDLLLSLAAALSLLQYPHEPDFEIGGEHC